MNCDKCKKLLQAFIDGDLDGAPDREIREHLEKCPDCRAEHDRMAKMRGFLAQLKEVEVPEGDKELFINALMDRIEAERGKKYRKRADWRPALVGAIVVVCALIIFVWIPRPERIPSIEPAPGLNAVQNMRLDFFIMSAYRDHTLATQAEFMSDPSLAAELTRLSGQVFDVTHGDFISTEPSDMPE
ncbi:MAG TPA: hypothetical protein ENN67_07490 [Firmicutes bacterium]|nr:hypothetical protein [Bacillota bacterium]